MELFYFIFGILFIEIIFPTLESLSSLLLTKIESKKGKYNEIINQSNINMRKANEETEVEEDSKNKHFGFYTPDKDEDDNK